MKRVIMLAAAAALSTASIAGWAAESSVEAQCKASAKTHHITAAKMDAYVKSCVESHSKRETSNAAPSNTPSHNAK